MTERDFVYWLRGFIELAKPEGMTLEQVKEVKRHLDLVMKSAVTLPDFPSLTRQQTHIGAAVC